LAELKLVKQQIKSFIEGFIGVFKPYLAEGNRSSIREIMVVIHLGIKMGFDFYISDVKAFLRVHIMQIVLLRFIG
jgi:hypothetical protein